MLSDIIYEHLKKYYDATYDDLIVLCIGTDRSTGDCLGPLIGYKLSHVSRLYSNVHVLGTLEAPVHAKNLIENIDRIYSSYNNPFVIAVDACLGKLERVGYINVAKGPLKPGAGVNKDLPHVGDMHITGIVNIGGFMEYMILQNTRLGTVMKMADIISSSFITSLWKFFKQKEKLTTN
ncbi:spore protease YyaC [Proteiniborus sp. DW1]|uniref:spore protease YyaC n=1 Tax=Proteiniborus sp. DW1 TaxID=1889883 RepID=UPI001FA85885|nr:spore protease YyaC [Proteiniborus sp. DW1]